MNSSNNAEQVMDQFHININTHKSFHPIRSEVFTPFQSSILLSPPALVSASSSASTQSGSRSWDFWDISLLLLFVLGLTGNLLSIVVMSRKRMRNTNASLFVTSLAMSDCLFLFVKFVSNVIKIHKLPIFSACIVIQNVLPHTTLFVSVWLVIITSLERAVAVLYPFRVAILFSRQRCKMLIIAMCVFFFALSNTTTPCLEYHKQKPYYCLIKGTINGTCFQYYSYVFPWIKAWLGAWIPSVLGIILNVLIARGLFEASRARQNIVVQEVAPLRANKPNHNNTVCIVQTAQKLVINGKVLHNQRLKVDSSPPCSPLKLKSSSSTPSTKALTQLHFDDEQQHHHHQQKQVNQQQLQQLLLHQQQDDRRRRSQTFSSSSNNSTHQLNREKQVTVMLMAISISFMILSFPYSAFELLRRFNVDLPLLKDRNTSRFVLLLLDINHATNFVLYCLTGQKFRTELKLLLLKFFMPARYLHNYKPNVSPPTSLNYYSSAVQFRRGVVVE